MESEEEIWKPITNFEGRFIGLFEVSNLGRIRGVEGRPFKYWRFGQENIRRLPARIMKQFGYGHKRLHKQVNLPGIIPAKVHVLVATAFIGPNPGGMDVDHLDEDPTNNRATNLEWTTRAENTRRGYERGSHIPVTGHPRDNKGRFLPGSFKA